ncbi:MAG: glycosyltransferase [Magnetococcales bacterium]|nr:glycosyltransferase [Magnetococcales bacterium]
MRAAKKVIIVTPGLERGGGADAVGRGLYSGFSELPNIEATLFDYGMFKKNFEQMLTCNDDGLLFEMTSQHLITKSVETTPDLIIVLTLTPITQYFVLLLRKLGIKVVHWFVEDYRRINWQEMLQPYDHILTYQKQFLREDLAGGGINSCSYLPVGCEYPEPSTVFQNSEKPFQIAYMGFPYDNRKRVVEYLLNNGINLNIWGFGWQKFKDNPLIANALQLEGRWLNLADTRDVYKKSQIVLNIHSAIVHKDAEIYMEDEMVNSNLFEICASGAFQIVERRPGVLEYFEEDKEIVCYATKEELVEKINYYLSRPEECKKIARAGYLKTMNNHRFSHRAQTVLRELGLT